MAFQQHHDKEPDKEQQILATSGKMNVLHNLMFAVCCLQYRTKLETQCIERNNVFLEVSGQDVWKEWNLPIPREIL